VAVETDHTGEARVSTGWFVTTGGAKALSHFSFSIALTPFSKTEGQGNLAHIF
jgi:hypothetical protein